MIWFIMIAAGLFTFATRFIMLSNGISNRPPPWLVDALGFVTRQTLITLNGARALLAFLYPV